MSINDDIEEAKRINIDKPGYRRGKKINIHKDPDLPKPVVKKSLLARIREYLPKKKKK